MSDIIPERSNRDGNRNSPSRIDSLRHRIENVMKGFHGSNAIAYKNKNEYVTYSRPADCLRASTSTDEFEPDNKQIWPVLNNMGASLPIRLLCRPHRADDPNWTVPVSGKTPIQTFPQSKGLKLRQVDEIINDKQLFNQFVPPSQLEPVGTSYRLPNSTTSSSNSHTPKTLEPPLSTVQGVLDIITETSRKPNRPAVKKRSTASLAVSTGTNRPRKSSLLKSEITSASQKPTPTQVGSKKPMSLLTNNNNNRPRVSSKSTSAQKIKYNQDIPDLIEARNYLLEETDEVEYKKLDHLIEAQPNTRIMPRPKLFLHFKKSLPALQKAAEKYIPSGKAIEQEPTVNKKSGLPENPTTSPLKNKHVDIPTNTSTTTTTPTSAPTVVTPSPPPAIKKSLSDPPKTTQEKVVQDKPAYASSVTAAFLRKMKIPKRKSSEIELEEGETISPSPSPRHPDILPPPSVKSEPRRSRYDNTEIEDVATPSVQEPVVSSATVAIAPTAPAPASAAAASAAVTTSSSSTGSSSTSRKYSRREEERSSSRRRDRYADDVRRASTSSKRSHYRSRSRSRSPKRSPNRSVSRRRQNSVESSRRQEKRKSIESSKYDEPTAVAPTSKRQRVDKESSSSRDRDRLAEKERSAEKDRAAEKDRMLEKDRLLEKERLMVEKEKLIAEKEKAAAEKERLAVEKEKTAEKERLAVEKERLAAEKERAEKERVEKERAEKDRPAEKNRAAPSSSSSSTTTTAAEKESSNSSSNSNSKRASASTTTTTTTSTEKALSATAANAETPEQFKVFLFMFSKLAHANKRRGDGQTNPIFAMIDHFHAFCDYILNFYYVDRLNPTANFKQASIAWKSIFPFTDSLLKKLESQKEYELYGLCIRLNSLIRFYMYSRMESSTRPVLLQQMNNTNGEKMTDRACVELSENLLHEYEKAERAYKESERYMGFSTLVTQYPTTFRNVCTEGNLLAGITLGGEAGVSVTPMFPFSPYSPLHHAAIVAKCILAEYVTKNNLKYTPISKFDEFM